MNAFAGIDTASTDSPDSPVMGQMSEFASLDPFQAGVCDFDGNTLYVGDVVVEAVMTRDGINCPKMSASPEMYDVYLYGPDVLLSALNGDLTDTSLSFAIMAVGSTARDVSNLVLIRSQKSGKYYLYPAFHLAWVGGVED